MKRNKIYCSAIHTVTQSNSREVGDCNVAFMKLGLKGNAKLAQTRICMERIVYRDAQEICLHLLISPMQFSSPFFSPLPLHPLHTPFVPSVSFPLCIPLTISLYFVFPLLTCIIFHHRQTRRMSIYSLCSFSLSLPVPSCLSSAGFHSLVRLCIIFIPFYLVNL